MYAETGGRVRMGPSAGFFYRNPKVYLVFFILILLVLLPVLLTVG